MRAAAGGDPPRAMPFGHPTGASQALDLYLAEALTAAATRKTMQKPDYNTPARHGPAVPLGNNQPNRLQTTVTMSVDEYASTVDRYEALLAECAEECFGIRRDPSPTLFVEDSLPTAAAPAPRSAAEGEHEPTPMDAECTSSPDGGASNGRLLLANVESTRRRMAAMRARLGRSPR